MKWNIGVKWVKMFYNIKFGHLRYSKFVKQSKHVKCEVNTIDTRRMSLT